MWERNYTVKRGEVWERLILLKDRRTRRKRVPVEAQATILIDGTKYVIPTEITFEGGVKLVMSSLNTEWLEDGVYPWDMAVIVSRSAALTSTPLAQTIAVYGTITVRTYDNITPLLSDNEPEALEELT